VIEMRREQKRNAVNRELADELDAAFNQLEDDPSCGPGCSPARRRFFRRSDLTAKR